MAKPEVKAPILTPGEIYQLYWNGELREEDVLTALEEFYVSLLKTPAPSSAEVALIEKQAKKTFRMIQKGEMPGGKPPVIGKAEVEKANILADYTRESLAFEATFEEAQGRLAEHYEEQGYSRKEANDKARGDLAELVSPKAEREAAEKAQKDLLASPTNRQNVLAAYAGGQGDINYAQAAERLRESYQAAGFNPEAAGEKTEADLFKVAPSPETSPLFEPFTEAGKPPPAPFNVVQSILEQFRAGKRTRQQAFEELSDAWQRLGASKTDADVAAQAVMAKQAQPILPFSGGGVLPGLAPFDPGAWPTQPGQPSPSGPVIPFGGQPRGTLPVGTPPFRTDREQELFKQSPRQKWESFLAQNPFGQLSASGQQTLEEQFGPLLTTFELTQPMESDFAKFIREGGQRLSPQQFRQKFQEVGGLYGQPFRTAQEEERMKTFRPNPKALGAYLSAVLPTVAPEFEAGARGVVEDIYNRFMAETPDVPFMEFLAKRGGTLF